MTKMEIASYLGILSVGLANSKGMDSVTEKVLEAVRSAQLIMYELAKQEIIELIKGEQE